MDIIIGLLLFVLIVVAPLYILIKLLKKIFTRSASNTKIEDVSTKQVNKENNAERKDYAFSNDLDKIAKGLTEDDDYTLIELGYKKIKIIRGKHEIILSNCSKHHAIKIIQLFENPDYYVNGRSKVVNIFLKNNIVFDNLKQYIDSNKLNYLNYIEESKQKIANWYGLSELDKSSFLHEFAINSSSIMPYTPHPNFYDLFEFDIFNNLDLDDNLLSNFDYELLYEYFKLRAKNKVYNVKPGSDKRKVLDRLQEKGLALSGKKIPIYLILSNLTLNNLNELSNNFEKKFSKKQQAVDFLTNIPNIIEYVEEIVSLRDLFIIDEDALGLEKEEFDTISKLWSITIIMIEVLYDTWHKSVAYYITDKGHIRHIGFACENCIMCNNHKDKMIQTELPLHIGCDCH